MLNNEDPLDSTALNSSTASFSITKLALAAPRHSGESVHHPAVGHLPKLWQSNLQCRAVSNSVEIGAHSLATLRAVARKELVRLAHHYSNQYGDFAKPANSDQVLLAGHQPELFHPGVWYKNFLLSRWGKQFDCAAINLVVDNDLGQNPAIQVPHQPAPTKTTGSNAALAQVPFDSPGFNLPFEERPIVDPNLFQSFGTRAKIVIAPLVNDPIVNQLWPQVLSAAKTISQDGQTNLGQAIAAGRHRLEAQANLQTLEIPLSQIANTESFANFVGQIIADLPRFHEIYNRCLAEYRTVYGLRSRAHPVPALARADDWIEIPFWIWQTRQPARKRVFVRQLGPSFFLSDRLGWQMEFSNQSAIGALSELSSQGIKLRPRALMTTMYSRLVLSDLFIHGIGGGQYDQLTDMISARFWGHPLPAFWAVSATMKLPTGATDDSPSDIAAIRHRLRELKYHPERFISADQSGWMSNTISKKHNWIRHRIEGTLVERHRAIAECNTELQPLVAAQRIRWERELSRLTSQVYENSILGSREFSFCLFSSDLVDDLRKMAASSREFS